MKTAIEIFTELDSLIRTKCVGQYYSDYYAGITSSIERRVYKQHNVQRKECHWSIEAPNKEIAGEVERMFIEKGTKGSLGGGSEKSTFVYIYRIMEETKEAPSFFDTDELVLERYAKPVIEMYPMINIYGFRFWKIRYTGKEQLDQVFPYIEKDVALKYAYAYAKEKGTTVEATGLEGKL